MGGLGGSGGVGGSIPSNTASSSAAASVSVNPSVSLGKVGGGTVTIGPFAPSFPGTGYSGSDAINAPPILTTLFGSTFAYAGLAVVALIGIWFIAKR